MSLFNRKKKVEEERAVDMTVDDILLSALIGTAGATKYSALNGA